MLSVPTSYRVRELLQQGKRGIYDSRMFLVVETCCESAANGWSFVLLSLVQIISSIAPGIFLSAHKRMYAFLLHLSAMQ